MRTQSIACLPGWSVVEAEICSGTGHCAVLRLLADATALLPLDGSANPFRIAALQDFDARELADDRAVRQYLRVYVGSVHTRGHSFGIYGSSAGKEEQGITVRRSPVGSVVCLTRVQYEDQLFAARLGITTGGDVTILRDRFLGRRPVSRNRTLWGPWEVIGLS